MRKLEFNEFGMCNMYLTKTYFNNTLYGKLSRFAVKELNQERVFPRDFASS